MTHLNNFLFDDDGPTTVEYAVMLAAMVIAALSAITLVGQQSATIWSDNDTGLQSAFSN